MGVLAPDVRQPSRNVPRGAMLACALCTLNFMFPLAVGSALQPDTSKWQPGFFVVLGQDVSGWLGDWLLVASVLNNLVCFNSCLGAYARGIQASALRGDIPLAWLGRSMTRWRTPVPALLLLSVFCAAFSAGFGFDTLVVIDTAVSTAMNCFLIAAFLVLRHRRQDLRPKFAIPGPRRLGGWIVTIPMISLVVFSYYILGTQEFWGPLTGLAVTVLAFLIGGGQVRWCGKARLDSDLATSEIGIGSLQQTPMYKR